MPVQVGRHSDVGLGLSAQQVDLSLIAEIRAEILPGVPDDDQAKPAPDHDPGIADDNTARVYKFNVARLTRRCLNSQPLCGSTRSAWPRGSQRPRASSPGSTWERHWRAG